MVAWGRLLTPMLLFLFDLLHTRGLPIPAAETCDQTIWDDTTENQGVHNALASCEEGTVSWHHPYGALRVLFTHPSPASEATILEVCLKAKVFHTTAKISLEETDEKGIEKLTHLLTLNVINSHMVREICFTVQDAVTLFVETEKDLSSTTIGQVDIDYDIQKKTAVALLQDPSEECRPCTDDELLLAACSADFVTYGSMEGIFHNEVTQETEIRVAANRVIRQSKVIFKTSPYLSTKSEDKVKDQKQFLSSENSLHNSIASKGALVGEVYAPKHCGIHQGSGQFLFLGRIRLGRALLKCAPRVEDFEKMWTLASHEGSTMCTLDL